MVKASDSSSDVLMHAWVRIPFLSHLLKSKYLKYKNISRANFKIKSRVEIRVRVKVRPWDKCESFAALNARGSFGELNARESFGGLNSRGSKSGLNFRGLKSDRKPLPSNYLRGW